MVLDIETPSEVMYSCLKQFGGIKNVELANTLFSKTFMYGGVPIVERLGERTLVSRTIARAAPGDFPEGAFRPFHESAQIVYSRIASRYPGAHGREKILGYFTGEACDRMGDCLQNLGLNDMLYRNMTDRLSQLDLVSIGDKLMLLVMQFIATGALGNPSRAAKLTQEYVRMISVANFATDVVREGEPLPEHAEQLGVRLGLCRLIDGKMRMPAYVLNATEEGTEIGALSTEEGAINDVGPGVSRRHLRVFRGADGCWYAQGLGSTNGSTVIRADDESQEVIEPPRSERTSGEDAPCVQIFANDTLCLAGRTQFAVLEIV
jgi:hypothetical protein